MNVIEYATTIEELNLLEIKHIKYYRETLGKKILYNISNGGDGNAPMTGRKHSIESKEKNRLSHLGKPSRMKGKHMSEEHKEKIRQSTLGRLGSFIGKTHSMQTREKIRKARLGVKRKPFTEKHIENIKKNHVGFKGCEAWNKGKTKETDERIRLSIDKSSETIRNQFKNGRIPWNKGLKAT